MCLYNFSVITYELSDDGHMQWAKHVCTETQSTIKGQLLCKLCGLLFLHYILNDVNVFSP